MEIEGTGCDLFEAPHQGFEELLVTTTAESALRRFADALVQSNEWPSHLAKRTPSASMGVTDLQSALKEYLMWAKGASGAAELLHTCMKAEMPRFVIETLEAIAKTLEPSEKPEEPISDGSATADV
jgi:hypothetical protein